MSDNNLFRIGNNRKMRHPNLTYGKGIGEGHFNIDWGLTKIMAEGKVEPADY